MQHIPPFFTPFFLALRNIRARRGRTLLTLMGIVLGVAVVLAIQITNESTLDALRQVFDRATGRASLLVVPRNRARQMLDEQVVERMQSAAGVEVAAPNLRVNTIPASQAGGWRLEFGINGVAAGTVLVLYGIDPALDPQVHNYVLSSGRLPRQDAYEVTLTAKYAGEHGLQEGDDLVLLTPQGVGRLRIVGLLADEGMAVANDGAVAFSPASVAQEMFARGGEYDEIALRLSRQVEGHPAALAGLKDALNERAGPVGEVVYPAARGQLVGQMMATYQLGLTFFSLIAIFVGAFLIYNTFSMTVVERTREIGMLRAIGMSRFYIMRMVLAEALLLALVGSALGVAAGVMLSRGLIDLTSNIAAADATQGRVSVTGLAQSLSVGIGVTLLAAFLPALQASQISPLEALRARSRSTQRIKSWVWAGGLALIVTGWLAVYRVPWREAVAFSAGSTAILMILLGATMTVPLGVGYLERLTRPLATAVFGNEGALGSANVRRSVGRTTLTIASLMVALTMVISIGSLANSFKEDLSGWVESAMGGDLYVRSPVVMRESLARQLASIPGVAVVSPGRYVTTKVAPGMVPQGTDREENIYFNAIDPATYRQIADMEFIAGQGDSAANWAALEQGGAVFITDVVADRYHIQQGDQLILLTNRGEHAFRVAGIMVDFAGQGLTVTGTYADMHRWFAENGADRFTVKVAAGVSVDQVKQAIEDRYGGRQYLSVQTTESFKKSILDVMFQAFRSFDILNLIGIIIGALGVINTLTMNVMERQQEIGGLRSLGLTRNQTLRMILAEALGLGVMGGIYGLVFGYLMAHILVQGVNLMLEYNLVFTFILQPYLVGILIALLVAQAAAIPPARRAAWMSIVEAIKHE